MLWGNFLFQFPPLIHKIIPPSPKKGQKNCPGYISACCNTSQWLCHCASSNKVAHTYLRYGFLLDPYVLMLSNERSCVITANMVNTILIRFYYFAEMHMPENIVHLKQTYLLRHSYGLSIFPLLVLIEQWLVLFIFFNVHNQKVIFCVWKRSGGINNQHDL